MINFVYKIFSFQEKILIEFLKHGTVATSSETSVGTQPGGSVTSRTASETPQVPSSASSHHHTGAKFRHGLLQLMIHTIDPLHDGQYAGSPTSFFIYICWWYYSFVRWFIVFMVCVVSTGCLAGRWRTF
ncbi:unnamed protein product [Brassicogethes aeneus]|uniref:Uncharacterized protein n=1 Tax=Brassicogethes aeneus TaxID=1431903 RepID=A0A9P0AWE5_BRAAE|nr:unnamed protein product [Brassicogethes aeneus]